MRRTVLFLLKKGEHQPDFWLEGDQWLTLYSPTSDHALEVLTKNFCEAVVADIEFQQTPAPTFFDKVLNRFPKVSRIALCNSDGQKPVRCGVSIHQYLQKPCTKDDIINAIERAQLLDTWMQKPRVSSLLKKLKKLPSIPAPYFRLIKELQSPSAHIETAGRIVAEDPVLTALVLKVVNSAVFSLARVITCPAEAVSYLGVERTKALAMVTHTFNQFGGLASSHFSVDQLWRHSVQTGGIGQMIVREETGDAKMAEEVFTAAVLHDVGKLMLAANLPAEYQHVVNQARQQAKTFFEAEHDVLGATHAEIGACLMGTWGLPPRLVEAIAFHHTPEQYFDRNLSVTTFLHMANALEHESRGEAVQQHTTQLNLEYLARLGMEKRLESWREILCGKPEG